MKAKNLVWARRPFFRSCGDEAPLASSPSFGGRGLEVRVVGRRVRPHANPHPNSLPRAGEGTHNAEERIFCRSRLLPFIVVAFSVLLVTCTPKGPPVSESEVTAVFEKTIPSSIEDKTWEKIPVHHAKLLLQDMVEPRLMQASTAFVDVQSVTDGQKIIFRLNWNDATVDDVPGPGRFGDAVAVQLPAVATPDVPAPQMGENGKPVEITYWSAIFQAMVNGRKDDIHAIYPQAKVDHYPFEAAPLKQGSAAQQEMAKRYAPARSLENPMSGPRTIPVQDLVAEGPGTLRPAEKLLSSGSGKHSQDGWTVIIVRPFPNGMQLGGRTQVAFAVWEGSHQEVGARKMRTAWIPLSLGSSK
jgi:ethylbenzene dehydrogenase